MTRDLIPKAVAIAALISLATLAYRAAGIDQVLLLLIGGLLGLSLYHASFGFTSGWRNFIQHRKSAGLRAQMIMLSIAVLLFFPVIQSGSLFGDSVSGFIKPAGIAVLVGAFLFGIGMPFGGGCASGTLFSLGGGSTKMIATLLFFIVGSVIGTVHMAWWRSLPSLQPISLTAELGLMPALGLSLGLFAVIGFGAWYWEKKRYGMIESIGKKTGGSKLLTGPWPMVWGAVALAILNFSTLVVADRPWGVSGAFALWGTKFMSVLGFDVAAFPAFESMETKLS